ncbi:hypothetical protein SDC9_186886 [bioreactor metagenome]|uniref:Uncharacterized protein n=1 Tax=bioreactor metagenome TaxID=1076179 RepID=A0A645HK11_9ZZZZ
MENDRGERAWQQIDVLERHGGHLNDCSKGVALSAALNSKKTDRVGMIEVQRDFPAGNLSEQSVLGRVSINAQHDVIADLNLRRGGRTLQLFMLGLNRLFRFNSNGSGRCVFFFFFRRNYGRSRYLLDGFRLYSLFFLGRYKCFLYGRMR